MLVIYLYFYQLFLATTPYSFEQAVKKVVFSSRKKKKDTQERSKNMHQECHVPKHSPYFI